MHSYPTCDSNQRSQILKKDKHLRPSGHYDFFLSCPKYYHQFSVLTHPLTVTLSQILPPVLCPHTPPNCSIYLGRGTKFYALTIVLDYCKSSQIVPPKNFPQNLRIPSLMPNFNSTSLWIRNMKLLYLCDKMNCHAARKTNMKKRPVGNWIHRSLPNT